MNDNSLTLWQKSLDEIKAYLLSAVPEQQFEHVWSWFDTVVLLEQRGRILVIGVPSKSFSELFSEKYMPYFQPVLQKHFGTEIVVRYKVHEIREEEKQSTDTTTAIKTRDGQQVLPSHLIPDYTFENFVKGASNKAVLNVAHAVAEIPNQATFNPLFIYGASGVGKTHVVTAIGHRVVEKFPQKRVLFVPAHLFMTQYMDAAKRNTINDFMYFYQSIEVLIIDDIQELTTEKTQHTFFHIFNHLQQNGRQIIFTCDRPPVEIKGIEERMLTRFKWGVVIELERPDVALRHDILTAKLRRDGLLKPGVNRFPKEVVSYIAEHVTSNVRDLQGVVNSIMAHSVMYDGDITLELAERVIARFVNLTSRQTTLEDILKGLCKLHKLKVSDIIGKSRKAEIVTVRQLVMYLTQKYTDMSLSQIGQALGKRDHATVIHGIRQAEKRIATDREYSRAVEAFEISLKKN